MQRSLINIKQLSISILSCLAIAACGGGGSSTTSASGKTVVGTAATGAAIAFATVDARDNAEQTATTTTDANGAYTLQFGNVITPPVLVRLTPPAGSSVSYQVAISNPSNVNQTVVINLTPLVTTATESALGVLASAIDPTQSANTPTPTQAAAVQTNLNLISTALTDYLAAAGLPSTTNLMTTAFAVGATGLDTVLDLVQASSVSTTGGYNMQLQSTLSGTANTQILINGSTTGPTPMTGAPTTGDAALIASIYSSFKPALENVFANQANIDGTPFTNILHNNFLYYGKDKTSYLDFMRGGTVTVLGNKVSITKVDQCNFINTPKTCAVEIEFRDPTTNELHLITNDWLLAYEPNSAQWLAYGNQFVHEFWLSTWHDKNIYLSNANPTSNEVGIKLYFDISNTGNCLASTPAANTTVQIAKIVYPGNTATTYTFSRNAISPCELTYASSPGDNSITIPDTIIAAHTAYFASATTKQFVSVKLYSDIAATQLIKEYKLPAEKFTPMTRSGAANMYGSLTTASATALSSYTGGTITLTANSISVPEIMNVGFYMSTSNYDKSALVSKSNPVYTFTNAFSNLILSHFSISVQDNKDRVFKTIYFP